MRWIKILLIITMLSIAPLPIRAAEPGRFLNQPAAYTEPEKTAADTRIIARTDGELMDHSSTAFYESFQLDQINDPFILIQAYQAYLQLDSKTQDEINELLKDQSNCRNLFEALNLAILSFNLGNTSKDLAVELDLKLKESRVENLQDVLLDPLKKDEFAKTYRSKVLFVKNYEEPLDDQSDAQETVENETADSTETVDEQITEQTPDQETEVIDEDSDPVDSSLDESVQEESGDIEDDQLLTENNADTENPGGDLAETEPLPDQNPAQEPANQEPALVDQWITLLTNKAALGRLQEPLFLFDVLEIYFTLPAADQGKIDQFFLQTTGNNLYSELAQAIELFNRSNTSYDSAINLRKRAAEFDLELPQIGLPGQRTPQDQPENDKTENSEQDNSPEEQAQSNTSQSPSLISSHNNSEANNKSQIVNSNPPTSSSSIQNSLPSTGLNNSLAGLNFTVLSKAKNQNIRIDGIGTVSLLPDFTDSQAWKESSSPYNTPILWGQCTWFAWGRFYEIYGYDPGFTGNGYECVKQLIASHPERFELSSTPSSGAVFSSDPAHNHVGIIISYDEKSTKMIMQEGNLDIVSNPNWQEAIEDWRTVEITLDNLKQLYGNVTFAVPVINSVKLTESKADSQEQELEVKKELETDDSQEKTANSIIAPKAASIEVYESQSLSDLKALMEDLDPLAIERYWAQTKK